MNFSSPERVYTVIETMRTADQPRAWNRALVNDLFNGLPPFTEEQQRDNRIQTNVNFLEPSNIAHNARRQLHNAFLKPGNYFSVSLDSGPPHLRRTWSRIITAEINRIMKRSLAYMEALRSTFAQIVLHGVGPVLWEDNVHWCPYARGIEDVLTPSGTLVSLENLNHMAVFRRYTATELYRKTHGKRVDKGWNVPLAERVIALLSKDYAQTSNWNDWRFPEKLSEDIKENAGYYGSDAVPTVNCWDFYFQSDDGKSWHRKIIIDSQQPTNASAVSSLIGDSKQYLYDSGKRKYADALAQIMHVQFADCSSVAPFRWHSVRSLGYLLYNICHLQNRLRCRLTDAQFMELLMYFRNVADEDREKLLSIQLHHMGIIPQGVDMVPANERWHPDMAFIEMGLSQNRQLMSENSSSFVQDIQRGEDGNTETATLTMAKVNNSSAIIGAMLNLAYTYQAHQYRENARRFCVTSDPECVEFRERCQRQGVPEQVFNVKMWDIEPERVLGGGNKTLEIAQADRLMAARNFYDPEAQRQILHIYTEANTDDPRLAEVLVPMQQQQISNSAHEANLAMGTLMLGLPVPPPREVAIIEYASTLLELLTIYVQRAEKSGGMVDQETLVGLVNVVQHIRPLIQHVAADQNEKQRVKIMMDALGQAESLIKAFAQRLREQMEAQSQQLDPETIAKVRAIELTTQAKLQGKQLTDAQKLQQKEIAFRQKIGQAQVKSAVDTQTKIAQAQSELATTQTHNIAELEKHNLQLAMDAEAHRQKMEMERQKTNQTKESPNP